jgi:flagellar motility protein MotE (MotC chaperone)
MNKPANKPRLVGDDEPDTGKMAAAMSAAPDIEVVPTEPVQDEAMVYRAEEQARLDKIKSDIWLVESETKAVDEQHRRQIEILEAKREASTNALAARLRRLHRVQAGCEAALLASVE